jgi:hypothetical protein
MASPTADKDSGKNTSTSGKPTRTGKTGGTDYHSPGVDVAKIRTLVARVVWAVFVVLALVLALAALLIALQANEDNSLVEFVKGLAAGVDLGVSVRGGSVVTAGSGGGGRVARCDLVHHRPRCR